MPDSYMILSCNYQTILSGYAVFSGTVCHTYQKIQTRIVFAAFQPGSIVFFVPARSELSRWKKCISQPDLLDFCSRTSGRRFLRDMQFFTYLLYLADDLKSLFHPAVFHVPCGFQPVVFHLSCLSE